MDPFIGQIQPFGFGFAPRGWALCDGQILPIAGNAALYSVLGTTSGGDGKTTFALPDLRGRVPMHVGIGPGLTARTSGQKGGSENNTLSVGNLPPHTHQLKGRAEPATSSKPTGNLLGAGQPIYEPGTADADMSAEAIGNTGSGQAVNNVQPFLAIYWCIVLTGIFPSRT